MSAAGERNWTRLSIRTEKQYEDPLFALLQGVRPRDGVETLDWEAGIEIRIWLPSLEVDAAFREKLRAEFESLKRWFPDFSCTMQEEVIPEENWAEAWKKDFRPLRIGRHFIICPSWLQTEIGENDILIQLDPGGAFGTGLHETTRLCLEAMEKLQLPRGKRMLDIGTGSGLLAIAALRLGFTAIGTDIDPYAIEVAEENARINQTEVEFRCGDLLDCLKEETKEFDLIIANILLPEILRLLPSLPAFLAPGACFLLSGLISEQVAEVRQKLEEQGLCFEGEEQLNGWSVLIGGRQSKIA